MNRAHLIITSYLCPVCMYWHKTTSKIGQRHRLYRTLPANSSFQENKA